MAVHPKILRKILTQFEGAKFNLVRVPIGGSDFSTHPYTLDDYSLDYDLDKFALSEFDLQRIEMFKKYNLSVLGSGKDWNLFDFFIYIFYYFYNPLWSLVCASLDERQ